MGGPRSTIKDKTHRPGMLPLLRCHMPLTSLSTGANVSTMLKIVAKDQRLAERGVVFKPRLSGGIRPGSVPCAKHWIKGHSPG